ncbi:hypothetical protein [Mesorhizobium sp. LNHC252B00]|uniref:hypothetical protein n=1 Tax=Mesorhizobium sp. LNHC252B00 TaxID=1287252 RepID=UPI00040813B9|nr:hypothetical protein [Mesorhizobium sp. LNHC252B00]
MDQKSEKPAACATTLTGFETSSTYASEHSKPALKRQAQDTPQGRWKAANQWAVWCHSALDAAIRRGLVKREPCRICGEPKTDGHHANYRKPADVDWLCRKHHKLVHRRALKVKPGGRS